MKNRLQPILIFTAGFLLAQFLFIIPVKGQVPQSFAFQAILRDTLGSVRTNDEVTLTLLIVKDNADGSLVYQEDHSVTTNSLGLVSLEVGKENTAAFNGIDWSGGPYFLKIAADGRLIGTSQLMSVPYALYADSTKEDSLIHTLGLFPDNYAGTVTDIEGNIYKTVTIGTQTWMAENLRTVTLNDNTPIALVTDNAIWAATTDPACCWYNNEAGNSFLSVNYGTLYNWHAVNTGKLCPAGWHILNAAEGTALINFLGGAEAAAAKLAEAGTKHWLFEELSSNETGFAALPGGMRNPGGAFADLGIAGFWWSVAEESLSTAYMWTIIMMHPQVVALAWPKTGGLSVRCLKD